MDDGNITPDNWNKYCNEPIKQIIVEGDHFSVWEPPYVYELARAFNKELENIV